MKRYSIINTKMPRELVLLQGTGCRWGKCTFCDYRKDISKNPFAINREILKKVTGCHGILDIINSGSGIELDSKTIDLIKKTAINKNIHTIWFEMHYMYRLRLTDFAAQFAPIKVKFRCGIESFDAKQRNTWNKGIPSNVTPTDVAKFFQGICLLCCTCDDKQERIVNDIKKAEEYFEYFSVNIFNNNDTKVMQDQKMVQWFINEIYPKLKNSTKAEILINNTDLGVG